MKKKSIINVLTDMFGQIVILLISIILPKLYIDSFGSEINGLISSINNLLVYINLLEAGVGGASVQALYKVINEDKDSVNGILSATDKFYKRTGCYFFTVVAILVFLYPVCIKSNINYVTISLLFLLSAVPSAIRYFFQGKYTILLQADNKTYILNLVNTFTNISINVLRAILIVLGMNVVVVQSSFAFISIIQMIILYSYVKKKYPYLNFKEPPRIEEINQKNYVLVHTICATIFSNIDILLLSLFVDLKIVSVYTVYNMIFLHVCNLVKGIANGTRASFGQLFYKNFHSFTSSYNIFSCFYRWMCLCLVSTTGIMILPFLCIYASSFSDVNYINYCLPILFTIANSLDAIRWPEVTVINSTGCFKETVVAAVIEMSLNLIGSFVLVKVFGIYGVLLATIIALLYRDIEMIVFIKKKVVRQDFLKEIVFLLFSITIEILLVFGSFQLIEYKKSYFELIPLGLLVFICCFIIYGVLTRIFFPRETKSIYLEMKSVIKGVLRNEKQI